MLVIIILNKLFASIQDPKDTPPPTKVETRDERLERRRRERAEQVAYKLEQQIAVWDPTTAGNITGDPFKTLFVARIVSLGCLKNLLLHSLSHLQHSMHTCTGFNLLIVFYYVDYKMFTFFRTMIHLSQNCGGSLKFMDPLRK